MFRFILRVVGIVLLALAVVMSVLDIARSISASSLVYTPFAKTWADVSPATLLAARDGVQNSPVAFLWDPVIVFFLALPSWLLLWLIAMLMLRLGQKRSNRFGRFARL